MNNNYKYSNDKLRKHSYGSHTPGSHFTPGFNQIQEIRDILNDPTKFANCRADPQGNENVESFMYNAGTNIGFLGRNRTTTWIQIIVQNDKRRIHAFPVSKSRALRE